MSTTVKLKRGSGSDPSASDMVVGEPVIRTDTAELFFKKDDGSVAKVSGGGGGPDFKYLALRNAANDGSASYPGNDFTLVTSGTTTAVSPAAANTLLVSYGGVIQRPNSGTSTSGITGFIVDGSRIKTATNLAAAPDFILYQESGGIGEPSDNTVTSAKIVADAVTGAKIADDAVGAEHIEVLDAALQFADSVQAQFGTHDDLRIYHDNTHGYVSNRKNNLYVSAPNYVQIVSTETDGGTQETSAKFLRNGNVELYYDNSNKLQTISTGVQINGNLNVPTGDVQLNDTKKLRLGNSQDLDIFHSGGENFIRGNASASRLYIDCCEDLRVRHLDTDGQNAESMIWAKADGAVELYYNNLKKLETTSSGIAMAGVENAGAQLKIGASSDIQIEHDGSNSYITNATGNLELQSDSVLKLRSKTNGPEEYIVCTFNGAVELYYNNSQKLATSSTGIWVGGAISGESVDIADNKKILLGSHDDLELYHDGSNSYINHVGTGNLRLVGNSNIILQDNNAETLASFNPNAGVELYYDNSKKIETTSLGATITRDLTLNHASGDTALRWAVGGTNKFSLYESSGTLRLYDNTNSVERLRIVSDGKVGIGTESPNRILSVKGNGGQMSIIDDDDSKMQFYVNSGTGSIWATGGGGTNGSLDFATTPSGGSTTSRMQISASGDVTLNTGSLVIGTAGEGIDFSAQTASSTGTTGDETLDHYEEGTWSPTILGSSSAGSYSYESVRHGGKYTRIGNLVYIEGVIRISSINSAGSGSLKFGGFPFALGSLITSAWGPGSGIQVFHYGYGSNSTASATPPPFVLSASGGSSTAQAYSYGKNYGVDTDITDLSSVYWIYMISGCYQV